MSRFMIGTDFAFYEVKELPLIGGSLFAASALDTLELIGQFESKDHAQQACARDFARCKAVGRLILAHKAFRINAPKTLNGYFKNAQGHAEPDPPCPERALA